MFKPGELPSTRLVGSDDPEGIGIGLESAIFHLPPPDEERLLAWQAKAFEKMAGLSPDIAKAAKGESVGDLQRVEAAKSEKEKIMKGHIRERSPGHWAIVIDLRDGAGSR